MPLTQNQPKPSLLRRLFGDPISESTDKEWPELRGALASVQTQRPDVEGQNTSIGPMSRFNKWRSGNADGITDMFGRVQINREKMAQNPDNTEDLLYKTLNHELTHTNQGMNIGGIGIGRTFQKFFNRQALEDDAVNSEDRYRRRTKDIELRAPIQNSAK